MYLIRIIIIVLVVFYLLEWLVKLILPLVVKQQMDKFQNQYNKQNPDAQKKKNRREGTVTVEKVEKKQDSSPHDDDYVDFEEIK